MRMVEAAQAPVVICETPWPGIADDVALLREVFAEPPTSESGSKSVESLSPDKASH